MKLGVEDGKVSITDYDPAWVQEAQRMIGLLKSILTGPDIIDIQHVGSTAVRGLPAKPIIEIGVAVRSQDSVERYRPVLEANGFRYQGEIKPDDWMYYMSHPDRNDHTHHIHMITAGSSCWTDYLVFRDYLNAFPEEMKYYGDVNRKLSAATGNLRDLYQGQKFSYIEPIKERARKWAKSRAEHRNEEADHTEQ